MQRAPDRRDSLAADLTIFPMDGEKQRNSWANCDSLALAMSNLDDGTAGELETVANGQLAMDQTLHLKHVAHSLETMFFWK